MPKSAEELLIEISAASRRTRDVALLALLEDIKVFLESKPPAHPEEQAPLEPQAGRPPRADKLPDRERQLRRNTYQRNLMRKRRAKQKEIKLAIINSTSKGPDRASDQAAPNPGKDYALVEGFAQAHGKPPWEDE